MRLITGNDRSRRAGNSALTPPPCDSSGPRKRLTVSDYGYLAGIIDGEAYLYACTGGGKHRVRIRVRMCDEIVIEWLHVRFGGRRSTWQPQGGRLQYEWCVSSHPDVKRILDDVLSYLVAKPQRAQLMLTWLADKKDSSWLALISTNTRTIHPVRTRVTNEVTVPSAKTKGRRAKARRIKRGRSDGVETKGQRAKAGESSTGNAYAASK